MPFFWNFFFLHICIIKSLKFLYLLFLELFCFISLAKFWVLGQCLTTFWLSIFHVWFHFFVQFLLLNNQFSLNLIDLIVRFSINIYLCFLSSVLPFILFITLLINLLVSSISIVSKSSLLFTFILNQNSCLDAIYDSFPFLYVVRVKVS